ncbi:MAG TPA: thioredoxin family protein [Candidatus Limnocylindrales bacterium]|nr:thioredoxin family protein [Candidatus Limnocylindrales bacterium]
MIHLKLLTTSGCSRCDRAKQVIEKVWPDFPDVKVEIINLIDHAELAVQYGVMVSPALVINEKVAFVGGVSENQLREKLMQVGEYP